MKEIRIDRRRGERGKEKGDEAEKEREKDRPTVSECDRKHRERQTDRQRLSV